jgi:hypothetical protein
VSSVKSVVKNSPFHLPNGGVGRVFSSEMKFPKVPRQTKADDAALPVVLTIGHSNRPIDEFIRLLQAHGVTRVLDVRSVPRSFHNPQFNKDTLP